MAKEKSNKKLKDEALSELEARLMLVEKKLKKWDLDEISELDAKDTLEKLEEFLKKNDQLTDRMYLTEQTQMFQLDVFQFMARFPQEWPLLKEKISEAYDTAQKKLEEKATKIYEEFIENFPDAVVHQNTIAALLDKDQSLSPEDAYNKLRDFYLEKGFDWSIPLEEFEKEEIAGEGDNEFEEETPPF